MVDKLKAEFASLLLAVVDQLTLTSRVSNMPLYLPLSIYYTPNCKRPTPASVQSALHHSIVPPIYFYLGLEFNARLSSH